MAQPPHSVWTASETQERLLDNISRMAAFDMERILQEEDKTDSKVSTKVKIIYTNHRGIKSQRTVIPYHRGIRFGCSEWHKQPQWLMSAFDIDKAETREFAMKDIERWTPVNE